MIRAALRAFGDSFPRLANGYRLVRDQKQLRAGVFEKSAYGFEFINFPALIYGEFEPDEVEFVQECLATAEIFVDIGSNIGLYTCLAANRGRHSIVIEPLRGNLDYLYANLSRNGFTDVEVYPLALGEKAGLARLYGGFTGASLVPHWEHTPLHYSRIVPLSTLDILIGHRFKDRNILIKMDVEGFELAVLRGATQILRQEPKPIWLVEICLTEHHPSGVNPDFAEVFEVFWLSGYAAMTCDKERRLVTGADVSRWIRERNRDFGGQNFIFVPSGIST